MFIHWFPLPFWLRLSEINLDKNETRHLQMGLSLSSRAGNFWNLDTVSSIFFEITSETLRLNQLYCKIIRLYQLYRFARGPYLSMAHSKTHVRFYREHRRHGNSTIFCCMIKIISSWRRKTAFQCWHTLKQPTPPLPEAFRSFSVTRPSPSLTGSILPNVEEVAETLLVR